MQIQSLEEAIVHRKIHMIFSFQDQVVGELPHRSLLKLLTNVSKKSGTKDLITHRNLEHPFDGCYKEERDAKSINKEQ